MIPLNYIFDRPITLTNCDLEPIHIPNAIQPHGILLVFEPENWQILQVSDNTESLLGYSPDELLNKSLTDLFDAESQKAIARCLLGNFDAVNPLTLNLVNYHPAALIPTHYPLTNASPDLSFSVLRSVSPIHIEYLQNMKVGASLSILLLKDNQLWGLIACHHNTPKYLPYQTRTLCEFIGQIMSLELSNKEENENLDDKIRLKNLQSDFVESIYQAEDFVEAVGRDRERLLSLVNATGAAIISNDLVRLFGKTPSENEINQLIDWVVPLLQNNFYYTDCLPKVYPPAVEFKDLACGLIVLSIKTYGNICFNGYITHFISILV